MTLRRVGTYGIVLLGCWVLGVGICIEVLNARAGGVLPRRNIDGAQNPKWLVSAVKGVRQNLERQWRHEHGWGDENPLPPEIADKIEGRLSLIEPRIRAEVSLRRVIGSYGLLQYPLAMILMLVSAAVGRKTPQPVLRRVLFGFGALGLIGLLQAYGREFWTSLGW